MNIASLELSRQVYEILGWGSMLNDLDHLWGIDEEGRSAIVTSSEYARGKNKIGIPTTLIPAYTLGFLLWKILPEVSPTFVLQSDGKTLIIYTDTDFKEHAYYAETPEDALCKLCLDVWEQGGLR